ncbi:putative transposable element [Trichonephila clavipes]|nr:putative transposable element [Trichonephila clavipes]
MITNFFIPELNNHNVQELWFQQDGATCHTARATIDLLKNTFGDRLISRFGPVNWTPRSCDLTPLDYFLWGYVNCASENSAGIFLGGLLVTLNSVSGRKSLWRLCRFFMLVEYCIAIGQAPAIQYAKIQDKKLGCKDFGSLDSKGEKLSLLVVRNEANPQVNVETPSHPEKLTVWCALWAGGIIGPYFFKNDEGHNVTVNGDRFGDRLISRFGPVNWPPRSCDLIPLDYFLWGYVKSLVYPDKPQTFDHLEDNIHRVIADIRPQMLGKVIKNWSSRLDYIRASRGSPMPEIIFKM